VGVVPKRRWKGIQKAKKKSEKREHLLLVYKYGEKKKKSLPDPGKKGLGSILVNKRQINN